ncbi:MAG: type III polyketide synthase [Alphaproteobacteria bacterium]|nr:type III polyketide synthase [Alphaproteobacteria bacterium]
MAHIRAVATAVPPHLLEQGTAEALARAAFAGRVDRFERLAPAYRNAGVATRSASVPDEWFLAPQGWASRGRAFVPVATDLLATAAADCLRRAGVEAAAVDAVVCVCSTGIATPTLDAHVAGRIGLRPDIVRLPIFGLGCAGGVLGLARAADLADAGPGRRVLLLLVELCSLAFRRADASVCNVIATTLFGDGAAAVLLEPGEGPGRIVATGEHLWPATLDVMGWTVEDDGLGVVFSREIPYLAATRLRPAADRFLARHDMTLDGIAHLVCHPGGAKVVDALAVAFDRPPAGFAAERAVLRRFGNMSSATIWFVLAERLAQGLSGRTLMSALGPGFTAGFAVVDW